MKPVLLSTFFIILVLFSCNQNKENDTNNSTKDTVLTKITESDISKLKYLEFSLDSKTQRIIEKWEEYLELELIVAKIKKGDLSYLKDNNEVITNFIKDLKNTIPDTINTPSVEARITALETKLYKLESLYNLTTTSKEGLKLTIKEFLEAVSNLNLQMNKKLEKDSRNIEKP